MSVRLTMMVSPRATTPILAGLMSLKITFSVSGAS